MLRKIISFSLLSAILVSTISCGNPKSASSSMYGSRSLGDTISNNINKMINTTEDGLTGTNYNMATNTNKYRVSPNTYKTSVRNMNTRTVKYPVDRNISTSIVGATNNQMMNDSNTLSRGYVNIENKHYTTALPNRRITKMPVVGTSTYNGANTVGKSSVNMTNSTPNMTTAQNAKLTTVGKSNLTGATMTGANTPLSPLANTITDVATSPNVLANNNVVTSPRTMTTNKVATNLNTVAKNNVATTPNTMTKNNVATTPNAMNLNRTATTPNAMNTNNVVTTGDITARNNINATIPNTTVNNNVTTGVPNTMTNNKVNSTPSTVANRTMTKVGQTTMPSTNSAMIDTNSSVSETIMA